MRQVLLDFVVIVMQKAPNLEKLSFESSGLDGAAGEKICTALTKSKITSIKDINLWGISGWFDTDVKCTAWSRVFKSQAQLTRLQLYALNVSARGSA